MIFICHKTPASMFVNFPFFTFFTKHTQTHTYTPLTIVNFCCCLKTNYRNKYIIHFRSDKMDYFNRQYFCNVVFSSQYTFEYLGPYCAALFLFKTFSFLIEFPNTKLVASQYTISKWVIFIFGKFTFTYTPI